MPKILLVDDDLGFRDSIAKSLSGAGFAVLTAADGQEALTLFKSQPDQIDAIVSDVKMPGLDGLELLKQIRSTTTKPFVLMTGFGDLIEAQEAHSLGATEFLAKPFKIDELAPLLTGLLGQPTTSGRANLEASYCKLGIDDFATGRKIKFSIYLRVADDRFVKIAHKGEDISVDRIKAYKSKGLSFLYLRQDDFNRYVGFDLDLADLRQESDKEGRTKKFSLIRESAEILHKKIRHDGLDRQTFEAASAFVEASISALTDDRAATELLAALKNHSDHVFVHSLGVSVYSVLISQHIKWNLPTNKFKVAIGGLLHDIGEKEIGQHILSTPKYEWSDEDWKDYESHVRLGYEMLEELKSIPEDVREIVKQHHENCAAKGFPSQLKKTSIHPMAKLIAIADELCYRILKTPDSDGEAPAEAIRDLRSKQSELFDKEYLGALCDMFKVPRT